MSAEQLQRVYMQHLMARMSHIRRNQPYIDATIRLKMEAQLQLLDALYNSVQGFDLNKKELPNERGKQ